jgi:hypothetical protein
MGDISVLILVILLFGASILLAIGFARLEMK